MIVPLRPAAAPAAKSAPVPLLAGNSQGSATSVQQVGYAFLILYLFLIYSRIFDVKLSNLHIPGISLRIIIVTLVLTGAFVGALKTPIGKWFGFLTLWFVLSIPTSVWRRGSKDVLVDAWIPAFVIFLSTVGLIVNYQQCRRAIYTVAWALFVLTLIAVFWGSTEETGRLYLPHGKFSNPNEMGQALLLGMPLWGLALLDTQSFVKKAFSSGVMFLMLIMVSKTGSRGSFIAFAATLFVVFLRSSAIGKLKLIIGGFVILALLVGLMPGKLVRRYTSFSEETDPVVNVDDDYDPDMQATAASSTKSRRELLKKSIKFTLRHPVFGVGPGMFPVAEDADAKENGQRVGKWQGTHNSYTQVSSELGIPALVAYVAIIVLSLKQTTALYRRTRGDPRLKGIGYCAMALNYCLVVYAVSVIFDYIAYSSMLSVFAGLAAALHQTAPYEIDRITATPAPAPMVPFAEFRPRWRPTAGAPQQA
ncbi:MAG TPA: O-antigen ligase family protein [Candidatus Acidoferrales bacterium]|nr:O-antigen ligase family protein [Candidatus Acidoferrales bacterium]